MKKFTDDKYRSAYEQGIAECLEIIQNSYDDTEHKYMKGCKRVHPEINHVDWLTNKILELVKS